MKKLYSLFVYLFLFQLLLAQNNDASIKGTVVDLEEIPVKNGIILINGERYQETTKQDGSFEIKGLPAGSHKVTILSADGKNQYSETIVLGVSEQKNVKFTIYKKGDIQNIVVSKSKKQPNGLESITRLPVNPRDMAQNISIIPQEIIEDQGALTLTDVAKNIPGVTLFSSYGGVRESMTIRGFRGAPVLKNGIQIDSDFRTASILTDINGVESVQVLKGSAAITQGIGNGLGSAGGVINVVTKIPQFVNKGQVSITSGSWGLFRPAFDYQAVLDKNGTVAFRIDGSYQRKDSYKSFVRNNRMYINPSLEWRPDEKTRIILEMDYMNDNSTPDRGTINLADIDRNELYRIPHNKFLGWATDNTHTETTTYFATLHRDLGNKLSLRAVYGAAVNEVTSRGVGALEGKFNKRGRSLTGSDSEDKNKTIQIDLFGKDIYTGKIKHTFQAGFDYKKSYRVGTTYNAVFVDSIDVFNKIPNYLPGRTALGRGTVGRPTESEVYGITVQEVVDFNKYIRAIASLRYSQTGGRTTSQAENEAWDPFFGLMITPIKNISVFGNYATTTSLRSANNPTRDGGVVGASVFKQFETGVKSDWFNNQLSVNATYFNIRNNDLAYEIFENGQGTRVYEKAGDITRQGVDLEVSGSITSNIKTILGYTYLDAQYQNSVAFVNGSAPMNASHNTANAWVYYLFDRGVLKDFSIGMGVYYIGKRPVNDYAADLRTDGHGTTPGVKPFDMPEYTTADLQLGYKYRKMELRVKYENIFDKLGYSSYYRGGYINQIDPANIKVQLSYKF